MKRMVHTHLLCLVVLLIAGSGDAVDQKDICTISLANGDRLDAQSVRVSGGNALLRPSAAPETELQLPLERVEGIRFGGTPARQEAGGGEVLRLLDGSVLMGKFVKLTDEWMEFEFEGSVTVRIPRSALDEFRHAPESATPPAPSPSAGPSANAEEPPNRRLVVGNAWVRGQQMQQGIAGGGPEFIIVDGRAGTSEGAQSDAGTGRGYVPSPMRTAVLSIRGDVLAGNVRELGDGSFVVDGGAVEARLAWASVAAIRFARSGVGNPPGSEEKNVLLCTISTRRGSMLVGTEPELTEKRFSVTVAGGQRVAVARQDVVEASFSSTGDVSALKRMLVWGAFADRDDEYRKTLELVKGQLGQGWEILEDFSPFESSFERGLQRAGVLLIPEMERGSPSREQAAKFKPTAEAFLRRGGKIIILGPTNNNTEFMRTAGLVDLAMQNQSDGFQVKFTPEGRRIFANVGESFTVTNSTCFYAIRNSMPAVALAERELGAPLVGRRMGRGWVIVMGMDYCSQNEQTVKILIDAVTLR